MTNEDKSLSELLEDAQTSNWKDLFDTSIKSGVSFLIPGVSQFFNDFVKSPSAKRLNKFLEVVVKEIEELKQKSFDQVNLEQESFKTTLNYALQIASRNHQEEKLNVLKNAVLNSALIDSIEEDKQLLFLRYIDELTPSHLKALDIIKNLSNYAEEQIIPFIKTQPNKETESIEYKLPILGELNQQSNFYNQCIKDLEDRGLVNFDDARDNRYPYNDIDFRPSIKPKIQSLKNSLNSLKNQENINKIVDIIKEIIESQIQVTDFIDNAQIRQLDYITALNESIFGYTLSGLYLQAKQIPKKITNLGELFFQFLTSPIV